MQLAGYRKVEVSAWLKSAIFFCYVSSGVVFLYKIERDMPEGTRNRPKQDYVLSLIRKGNRYEEHSGRILGI